MNPERFIQAPLNHGMPKLGENPMGMSWHDSAWIPMLNPSNVLDYFTERCNPFYDRTCNNETLKMQRLGPEHLNNMTGVEYHLLHCQEPILYVIRKQHRFSPNQVTPIADYYILAGIVYQAPDLSNIIGSRMVTMVNHMQSAFDEASSYAHYHPSKGYWWEFKDNEKKGKEKVKIKEEGGSVFQRRRVDILLAELSKKFPPKMPSPPQLEKQTTEEAVVPLKVEPKVEIKSEKPETPPVPTVSTTAPTTVAPSSAMATATLLPPPPPPPIAIKTEPGLPPPPRNVMKPPPEKKMRLV